MSIKLSKPMRVPTCRIFPRPQPVIKTRPIDILPPAPHIFPRDIQTKEPNAMEKHAAAMVAALAAAPNKTFDQKTLADAMVDHGAESIEYNKKWLRKYLPFELEHYRCRLGRGYARIHYKWKP